MAVLLCCCGCTTTKQPMTAELNGQGTFEAQTTSGTYTGQFAVDGIAFSVQIDLGPAQTMQWIYNGQTYTVSSGAGTENCMPTVFPADSIWRTLPEMLRTQWSAPDAWTDNENGLRRDFEGGWRMIFTDEKNAVLYFPDGKGQIVLHYASVL